MELPDCGAEIRVYPGDNREGSFLLLEAIFLVPFQAPQAFPPRHYVFDLWFPFPKGIRTAFSYDGEKRSAVEVQSVSGAVTIEFLKYHDVIF